MNRAFSYGGGRQSTAALVLAAHGKLAADCFIFANVGNDSENPETLSYFEQYAKPYAAAHGIEMIEVQRQFRDGRDPTLLAHLERDLAGVAIPMRMSGTGAPGNRKCTYDWKIRPVARYLKRDRGWTPPWEIALGISWDESHRISDAETEVDGIVYQKVYPLCDMRLTVADCGRLVAEAGLPPVPKSSCWFCPYHTRAAWSRMRLHQPEQFAAAVALEERLNGVRDRLGKDHLYFSDRLKPLDVAIPQGVEQLDMFGADEACTTGYCWT